MKTDGTNLRDLVDVDFANRSYIISESGKCVWHMNDYLVLKLNAESVKRVRTEFNFFEDEKVKFSVVYNVLPNNNVTISLPLEILRGQSWFVFPQPGCLKGTTSGCPTDISQINKIVISFPIINNGFPPSEMSKITIKRLYISKEEPDMAIKGNVVCDKFGQRADIEWDEKIHSEQELKELLLKEYKYYKSNGFSVVSDEYDRFGGWIKKNFHKKGYFYVTNDGNRDWIVDPDGNGFISFGIGYGSASRIGCSTIIYKNEDLFEWLPDETEEFAATWTVPSANPEFVKRYGTEMAKNRKMFNYTKANLIRVFGKDKWLDGWCTLLKGRMKKWGLNTICIGVDDENDEPAHIYARRVGMPYIYRMKDYPTTAEMIFRDFSDVLSEQFRENAVRFAKQLENFISDENFMGYYMNNEPFFMTSSYNLAEAALNCGDNTATRKRIVEILTAQYCDISALNIAWQTNYSDFESIKIPNGKSSEMLNDLDRLHGNLVESFWRIPAEECAKVTRRKAINFGFRSPGTWVKDFSRGVDFVDVFSVNCYSPSPKELLNNIDGINKPVIISEWHIGEASRRLYQNGLKASKNEQERALACKRYIEHAFAAKNCVGVHYFEYLDMALTGRFDGACAQIGLADVCCIPYEALAFELSQSGKNMYQIVSGLRPPFDGCTDEFSAYGD